MTRKKNLPQKRKSCSDSQSKDTINPNEIGQNVLDEKKLTKK